MTRANAAGSPGSAYDCASRPRSGGPSPPWGGLQCPRERGRPGGGGGRRGGGGGGGQTPPAGGGPGGGGPPLDRSLFGFVLRLLVLLGLDGDRLVVGVGLFEHLVGGGRLFLRLFGIFGLDLFVGVPAVAEERPAPV